MFLALAISAIDACELHRSLGKEEKEWWVCSECSSKGDCCQLIAGNIQSIDDDAIFLGSCKSLIAAVPTTLEGEGVYSFYRSDAVSSRPRLESNENPVIVWETRGGAEWTTADKSPFGDDHNRQPHYVTSTLSQDGGMHRQWHHHLTGLSPKTVSTSIWLLIFLTEDVFVDVEDIISGSITGGRLRQIHTSEIINIELPSFDSPQHVIGVELEADSEEIHLTTTLHLRYLEAQPNSTTTTLQLPNPILWNQQANALLKGTIVKDVATGLSGDSWWATAVTLCCGIVGALLLLKDLWQVCEWK
jgi:hypothetical protein